MSVPGELLERSVNVYLLIPQIKYFFLLFCVCMVREGGGGRENLMEVGEGVML